MEESGGKCNCIHLYEIITAQLALDTAPDLISHHAVNKARFIRL